MSNIQARIKTSEELRAQQLQARAQAAQQIRQQRYAKYGTKPRRSKLFPLHQLDQFS